jgi:hypothetical protein
VSIDKTPHIKKPTKKIRQGLFLSVFEKTGINEDGIRAAGIDRTTFYNWKEDPDFLSLYKKAEDAASDLLEREAVRRAVSGTQKPVFYKGEECGLIKEYSDTLLMFVMKARKPEKYRDNSENNKYGPQDGVPVIVREVNPRPVNDGGIKP